MDPSLSHMTAMKVETMPMSTRFFSILKDSRSSLSCLYMNLSRKNRIARGSGIPIQDIHRMVKQFDQTREMISNTQSYSKTPMFIAVDEEGGRIARGANSGRVDVPKVGAMEGRALVPVMPIIPSLVAIVAQ